MRRTLFDGLTHYEILGRDESILKFSNIPSAVAYLRPFKGDTSRMAILRGAIAGTSYSVHRLSDEQVLTAFASLLVSGRLKLLRSCQVLGAHRGGEEGVTEKAAKKAGAISAGPESRKHWVELRIVDDATGQPVPGVELVIKVPGGSFEQYTTDADGYVEINDILKGDCEVTCDSTDARLSNTLAYVRMG
jgi:hypothetical protein